MRPTSAPPSLPAHLLASDARSRRSQAEHADRAASGTKNTPSFKPTRLPPPPALRRSTQHAHFSRPLTWQLMLYMAVAPSEKIKCVARCPPTDAPLSRPSPCSHPRSALRSPSLRPKVLGRRPRRPRGSSRVHPKRTWGSPDSYKSQAASHKSQSTSCRLQATSYRLQATR